MTDNRRAASPSRERTPASKPHAPGSGTPMDTIPEREADRVVPRDPNETKSKDPASAPYPPEHDLPDPSGTRPRPL
ncbi:hypothetical protein WKR88_20315 [Trinickia caryophylli]|uniref:Uncharacterized protein n=1 Tax=Trinickia caryophylli TaxID=28094 RepID=A0A1X7G8M4_TRICW|nr:hypothetical protein [Trinickia caryophylli]TRX17622.1 hypothetical protein FNF07_04835 [Trinickia caryophylli]WQE11625.1 hypothetical protein U0034_18065 [Trinickia caryophylli]GLU34804.1 hypothetical protein Busp01_46460 [Trinickia caryophylli]SMF65745.1 hypothetical protein SAMN06295900_11454 [Trinickia caryophylli]